MIHYSKKQTNKKNGPEFLKKNNSVLTSYFPEEGTITWPNFSCLCLTIVKDIITVDYRIWAHKTLH